MPIFSFDELVTPLTRAEIQASFYRVYATLGLKTSSWKGGAVVRTMTWASSIVLSGFSALQASIAKSGFLELAEGPWLDLVAWYVYRQKRVAATFASGVLTLNNNGGGVYEADPDDLIFTNPATNKQYRNTAAVSIGSGEQNVLVPVRAIEAGSTSSSQTGAITEITTTLLQVTCTNASPLIGNDEELDPALRTRSLESLGALSPFGPWDAYASAIRNATRDDASTLGVTRIRPVKDGFGHVDVYVATDSGGLTGDIDDIESDLGIAYDAVKRWAEPLAVTATVLSATPLPIAVTYELWMYNTSGRTDLEVAAAVQLRLSNFIRSQPIAGNRIDSGPGKVYQDAVRTAIAATFPNQMFHVVVTTPAGDVVVDPDEVPTLGTVTPTIHQIAPGEGVSS